jgi:hypothetical protein
MYKYLVFWTLMKLMPASDRPIPKFDGFVDASMIVITCDSINSHIDYTFYYREFKTRDSAVAFLRNGENRINVHGLLLDSVLIPKDTTKSK